MMTPVIMEILRRHRVMLIIAGLLFIAVGAVYGYLAWYQEPALNEAQATWADLRRRTGITPKKDARQLFRQGQTDLQAIQAKIPQRREFPTLLGRIMEDAATSGVTIGTITYQPKHLKEAPLTAYGVSVAFYGTYAALKSLLADILAFDKLVVVDTVSLENRDYLEEKVTMGLQLTIYLQEGP